MAVFAKLGVVKPSATIVPMSKVMVLPEHIASQIAAGEVVERPSSVVKELVENSIDAGATKVTVSVEKGARTLRVADNGCGMTPEDLTLAFQRHATSKLSSADDLWKLTTLGFRGEALPSIASISKIACYTRPADATSGTLLESEDGHVKVGETGCALGTAIEVYDLFFNVPARLNFMKQSATEFAHIKETVQSLAIAHPTIMFELLLDGDMKLTTSGSGSLATTLFECGHFSGQEEIIEVDQIDPSHGFRLKACLAGAKHFRGDRKGIVSIVNQRPIRCSLAYKALDYAYADLIPRGRYPLAVSVLTVNADELDVNIHPSKKEIKYALGNEVFYFLQKSFVGALRRNRPTAMNESFAVETSRISSYEAPDQIPSRFPNQIALAPTPTVSERSSKTEPYPGRLSDAPLRQQSLFENNRQPKEISFNRQSATATIDDQGYPAPAAEPKELPLDWKLIGYLHNTYFLIQTAAGLSVVEQHIAHERVLYEQLLARSGAVKQADDYLQQLIVSCPLALTAEQSAVLLENQAQLTELGFEFELAGETINCVQVPATLAHTDYAKVVQELAQSLVETSSSTFKLEAAKTIACQSAIKNGMPLSDSQIMELLQNWFHCPRHETCPHGRPIKLDYSMKKLFQMFHPQ